MVHRTGHPTKRIENRLRLFFFLFEKECVPHQLQYRTTPPEVVMSISVRFLRRVRYMCKHRLLNLILSCESQADFSCFSLFLVIYPVLHCNYYVTVVLLLLLIRVLLLRRPVCYIISGF